MRSCNELKVLSLVHGCAGESVIQSDDPEWFFFCAREIKHSNRNRLNRMTEKGFWKITGNKRNIKVRGTNNVIGTKQTMVFHQGRVRNGVRTHWVIHEYQLATFPPHQVNLHVLLLSNFFFSLIAIHLSLWMKIEAVEFMNLY